METNRLLLPDPERGASSRVASDTQTGMSLTATRVGMTDSAVHRIGRLSCSRSVSVMCLPWKTGGVLIGINQTHGNARRHLVRTSCQYRLSDCLLPFVVFSRQAYNACGYRTYGSSGGGTGGADNNIGIACYFWSSSVSSTDSGQGFNWNINTNNGNFNENLNRSDNGFSVRLFHEGICQRLRKSISKNYDVEV